MRIFINVADVWRSFLLWMLSSNINSTGTASVLCKTIRFVCYCYHSLLSGHFHILIDFTGPYIFLVGENLAEINHINLQKLNE